MVRALPSQKCRRSTGCRRRTGGPDFEVVAVNVDTARLERAPAFLDEIRVKTLRRYSDPSADAFEALRLSGQALGLPTSLLIDREGCEIGVVAGPANWDLPEGGGGRGGAQGRLGNPLASAQQIDRDYHRENKSAENDEADYGGVEEALQIRRPLSRFLRLGRF